MPPVYDTHAAVRRLVEAGVPEPQAVAHVLEQTQLLANTIATKDDHRALEVRMDRLEVRMDRLEARMERLEERVGRIEKQLADLGADIRSSEARVIKYMVTLAGAVVALVKFL